MQFRNRKTLKKDSMMIAITTNTDTYFANKKLGLAWDFVNPHQFPLRDIIRQDSTKNAPVIINTIHDIASSLGCTVSFTNNQMNINGEPVYDV